MSTDSVFVTIGGEIIVLERLEVDVCCLLLLETEKGQMVIKNKLRKKMSDKVMSDELRACALKRLNGHQVQIIHGKKLKFGTQILQVIF